MFLSAKDVLPLDHPYIYLIEEGAVRTGFSYGAIGEKKITGLYGANHLISYEMLSLEGSFIDALTDTKLAKVKLNSFEENYFFKRLRHDNAYAHATSAGNMTHRVYGSLLWIAKTFGARHEFGLEIPFHVSHQCLGEMLGSWRTSISPQLKFLEEKKAIIVNRRNIIVNDRVDGAKLEKRKGK